MIQETDIDFIVMLLAYSWLLAISAGFMYSMVIITAAWPHMDYCGFWKAICEAHRRLV